MSNTNTSLPFVGKKVYYSGSIKGSPEKDPSFAKKLVAYMINHGAQVLSEHVAAENPDEMFTILAKKTGKTVEELKDMRENRFEDWAIYIRSLDLEWVDQCEYMVALVNAPSHGVGVEIQRALDKPKMGMQTTTILCLVHTDIHDKLSAMILGVSQKDYPNFVLKTYSSLEEAQKCIDEVFSN